MEPRARVLVVAESNDATATWLARKLVGSGFDVRVIDCIRYARVSIKLEGVPDGVAVRASLPDGRGVAFAKELRQIRPRVPILLLTCAEDLATRYSAVVLGRAEVVQDGQLDASLQVDRCFSGVSSVTCRSAGGAGRQLIRLSRRELQVAALVLEGVDQRKEIAQALGLSPETVKTVSERLRRKCLATTLRALRRRG